MAAVMNWGVDDCLIDLFGADAHKDISWIKESHDETVGWLISLSERDRWKLMRATFQGQGYFIVDKANPGDCAIGHFMMGVAQEFEMPCPWYAQMGEDHNWYIRMLNCRRVVECVSDIEVYRCRSLL